MNQKETLSNFYRILVVEDDFDLGKLLIHALSEVQAQVEHTVTINEASRLIDQNLYDIIVLDRMLPDGDGVTLSKQIREQGIGTLILMLTAKSNHDDKIEGFESGADDYLTKPFQVEELLARVKALLRRSSRFIAREQNLKSIKCGELEIDPQKQIVTKNCMDLELRPIEFRLIWFLAQNAGIVISRAELLEKVWGYKTVSYEQTVNTHVNRLRQKIENDIKAPEFVLSIRGTGYKFPTEEELFQARKNQGG